MKSPRITLCLLAIFIVTGFAAVAHARQDYPTKPITLLIPYPPGTGNDIVGRLVGNKVSEYVGQRVVAENRAGYSNVVCIAGPGGHATQRGESVKRQCRESVDAERCTRRVDESGRRAGVRFACGPGCFSQGRYGDVEQAPEGSGDQAAVVTLALPTSGG